MRIFLLTFMALVFLVSNINAKVSPSFDCAKAKTEVEKLICSDDELANLDVEMSEWYNKSMHWQSIIANKYNGAEKSMQSEWLNRRNSFECQPRVEDKKECLVSLYKEAIQVWKNKLLYFELGRAYRLPKISETEYNFKYVDALIKQGADLNGYITFSENCWYGPVYFTALSLNNIATFDYIVKHGADFEIKVRDKCVYKSPLDPVGAFRLFNEIMAQNPNLDYKRDGFYLFSFARKAIKKGGGTEDVATKNFQYVKDILNYGDMDVNYVSVANIKSNRFNYTLIAGNNVLTSMFKYINTSNSFRYDRLLHMVKYLTEQGIDVSYKNNEGHDALSYLNKNKHKFKDSEYQELKGLLEKKI